MTSFDAMCEMYKGESQKLYALISTVESTINSKNDTDDDDLSIHEIVETYYQVMNVSSMSEMLKQQQQQAAVDGPDSDANLESSSSKLAEKINATVKFISEKFNPDVHPKIMKELSDSILDTTKKLQSGSPGQKSKEEIESEAKLFEELRQKMSTKEFVEQYDKGLHHD